MLALPILNVRLNACHEDWQQMTPVALGHHCAQCDRVVLDFTTSTQADLAAAFQNSPDGRVCGRFRLEQLASRPLLRQKLRRFLVALVLVCGLGLSGQEAWAQVRKAALNTTPTVVAQQDHSATQPFGGVEQMPVFKGGQERMLKLLRNNMRRPTEAPQLEGKVFVGFTIDKQGYLRNAKVLKSLHPALDAEALRLVQLLDGQFTPGQQNHRPVDVRYTLPITFERR